MEEIGNGSSLQQRKTDGDKEVLQLVVRDAIAAYPLERETELLRGSQEKKVFEPSTTVHESEVESYDQRTQDV